MSTDLPRDFLERLIKCGSTQQFDELSEIFAEYPIAKVGSFMRQTYHFWYPIADSLPLADLEGLIRALTIAESRYPGFDGGSVSGVIWTFRRFCERSGDDQDGLADWVLSHTSNGWAPYGSSNGGAKSLAELRLHRQQELNRRTATANDEAERHRAAVVRKADKATRDIFSAIHRNDHKAVHALLLRGAKVNVAGPDGSTALEYARSLGNVEVIAILEVVPS